MMGTMNWSRYVRIGLRAGRRGRAPRARGGTPAERMFQIADCDISSFVGMPPVVCGGMREPVGGAIMGGDVAMAMGRPCTPGGARGAPPGGGGRPAANGGAANGAANGAGGAGGGAAFFSGAGGAGGAGGDAAAGAAAAAATAGSGLAASVGAGSDGALDAAVVSAGADAVVASTSAGADAADAVAPATTGSAVASPSTGSAESMLRMSIRSVAARLARASTPAASSGGLLERLLDAPSSS